MTILPRPPKWSASEPWLVFVPEWICVAVIALLDIPLAEVAGLSFRVTMHDANLIAVPLLGVAMLTRKLGGARAGLILEFLSLMLAAAPALVITTYVAAALAGPLIDSSLLASDRAIGFNWFEWFHFVTAHRPIANVLKILYDNLGTEALYFCLLMSLMGNAQRLREVFWLIYLALALTALGSWLAPALGPFQTFGLKSYGYFLPEMARLRSNAVLDLSIGQLQGVVTFPSFHTTMALAMIYAFRGTGAIGWLAMTVNLLMLPGIPVFGGHYLVDMVAGGLVFVLALAMVRVAPPLARAAAAGESVLAAA